MCAALFAACAKTPPAPGSAEKFVVGMECDYAPFNWTQMDESNGAWPIQAGGFAAGYDVEIAKKIAAGLGRELVIEKIEWTGLIPALESGMIDAIIAGMSPKEDRKVSADFSNPYYESDLVIVVRKDSAYASASSLADFAGAKITGQINTVHYDVIDQIGGVNKQNAMETFPAMIVAVTAGGIDGYVSERPGALSAMETNPGITFVAFEEGKGFVASPEDVAIAVALAKGSDLIDDINAVIDTITIEERTQLMLDALENQPISAQ
jgi:putative lysine transport system substrate-binding protein